MNDTTPEQAMKELTMVLLYLSRFNEGGDSLQIWTWPGKGMILGSSISWMKRI